MLTEPFAVFLINDPARDLDQLYDYIALHDAPQNADYVLREIERVFSRLSKFPERGHILRNCWQANPVGYAFCFLSPFPSAMNLS